MPSLLDLTNRALSEIGRPPVEAIKDSNDSMVLANKILELYKEVLQEYQWNFAIQYVNNSSPESINTNPDYVYAYQLPGNFGQFFKFANTGSQWPYYAIQNGILYANTLPVQYFYVVNDLPFEFWPVLESRRLVLYAASKAAMTLTNNEKLVAYLFNQAAEAKTRAILQNDTQRSIQTTPYNDYNRITFI